MVWNDYVYLSDDNRLRIINITNPELPIEMSFYERVGIRGIDVIEDIVFIARSALVEIIDVSDPSQPVYLNSFETGGIAIDILYKNDFLYISQGVDGLKKFEYTSPDIISEIGYYDLLGDVLILAIVDDIIYVADECGGLRILDNNSLSEFGKYNPVGCPHILSNL